MRASALIRFPAATLGGRPDGEGPGAPAGARLGTDTLLAGARRLETMLSGIRSITAAVVLAMTLAFDPASEIVALVLVVAAFALNYWVAAALRQLESAGDVDRLARTVLTCDALLAAGTYATFLHDPHAMPIAFVPLLVFELSLRLDTLGLAVALGVFGAALALRVHAQSDLIEGGSVRPPMLLVWIAVVILMAAFSREFRSRERAERAAMEERARIAGGFRATINELLERRDTAPDEVTRADVMQAMEDLCCREPEQCREIAARIADLVSEPYGGLGLTRREREIVGMLARGYPSARIAAELFVSPSTVRNHVHNIKAKLGVSSREEILDVVQHGRGSGPPIPPPS